MLSELKHPHHYNIWNSGNATWAQKFRIECQCAPLYDFISRRFTQR